MKMYSLIAAVLLIGGSMGLGMGYAENGEGEQAVQWTAAEQEKGYVVFSHSTLALLPGSHVPTREAIVEKVSCELARGEYESLQIGVHALAGDLSNVRLEVESDLGVRVYRLIDANTRKLLLGYPNPVPAWIHDVCLDESNVIDSLGKGTTSRFWLTFHADNNATSGNHSGKIRIRAAGSPETELDLIVTVRPFELQRARIAYAPFFYVEWGGGQALPKFAQTDAWIGRLFRDMAEHSHTSLTGLGYGVSGAQIDFSQLPPPENRTFTMLLPLAKEVGLTSPDIPVIHMAHNMVSHESEGGMTMGQKNRAMDWYEAERQKNGWPELVTYGWDEPAYPRPELREVFAPFRNVRMRVGTAMAAHAAYGHGELHDAWIVYAGQITPEMCAEAGRLGAEVWTYSCHLFATQPLHQRYLAGLYIWAHRLKGHTTWHYYAQGGYKCVWMREGDERPMPLVGWETRREGIDDYRYLQMLQDCVAAKSGDPLAAEAGGWLEALRARITTDPHQVEPGQPLELAEYDQIRAKAADYIQQLGPVPPEQIPPRPVPRLKDEAKPFRGKSVPECIAGLRAEVASVRRAAAWALFERGPEAAAATEALAEVLDDADVRMPALRALEAIGPEAYIAVPKIAALLSHPDAFVRLGATFAFSAIGPTAVEPLRVALKDDFPPVALEAGKALARLGPAAEAALPEAMELLGHPTSQYHLAALKIIAAVGPEKAAAAVPKIIECYVAKKGGGANEADLLASFGPAAAEAIPALEKYATPDYFWVPHTYRALFYIRGETADLENMVNLLKNADFPTHPKGYVINHLRAMGVKAKPVEGLVRELLTSDEVADQFKAGLREFLKDLEAGKQPEPVMP